ncbi:hypothetical protein Z949_3404 [Sulfitobacter guttiformis KCTC 32187]|nr:hypothetical protein Z949_3404 [Sulfitobacter guttiformis KCTC 32187]
MLKENTALKVGYAKFEDCAMRFLTAQSVPPLRRRQWTL